MKKTILLLAAIFVASVSNVKADVITQWNFNRDADGNLPNASSPAPSAGAGTASLFGGVQATGTGFASGNANSGSSDPNTTAPGDPLGNNGWQLNGNWNPSGVDLSQGASFAVSTSGFQDNVIVSWDLRQSNSSSRFSAFQYTLDGSNWFTMTDPTRVSVGTNPVGDGNGSVTSGGLLSRTFGDRWLNVNQVNLSGLGAGNNADFAFRIVAAHDPDGTTFVRSDTGASPIAATGTWRFDMVTVSATAIPEPSTAFVLGLIGLTSVVVRRRRQA